MRNIIGKTVKGIVDRPIGSNHPGHSETVYPINSGYVEGIIAGDGENQDVYVLGTDEPVESFEGNPVFFNFRLIWG